eukprot:GHVS01036767.1.p1 GENE.GHVS01036767.1~~GHVS01036767.1.p1  ORF type:complete len:1021 (-),score=160.91 GHVS01036767.1:392-3454(-)
MKLSLYIITVIVLLNQQLSSLSCSSTPPFLPLPSTADYTQHRSSPLSSGPVGAFKLPSRLASSPPPPSSTSSSHPPHHPPVQLTDPVDPTTSLFILLGLQHRNITDAEELLKQVSSPRHPNYGKYITTQYWKEHFSPTDNNLRLLQQHFVTYFNMTPVIALTGDLVKVGPLAVNDFEKVYNTTVVQYRAGSDGGEQTTGVVAYKLGSPMHMPQEIREIVEFVDLSAPMHFYSKNTHHKRQQHVKQQHQQHQPFPHRRASPDKHNKHNNRTTPPQPSQTSTASDILLSGFKFPSRLLPSSLYDIAPIVNPLTYTGADGYIAFSFMPYCWNGEANNQVIQRKEDGGHVCGNNRRLTGETGTKNEKLQKEQQCKVDELCPSMFAPPSFAASPPPTNSTDISDNPAIVSFEVILHQPETEVTKMVEMASVFPVLWSREGHCNDMPCVELNTTIGNVPNYGQTWIAIRSIFSNGRRSSFSPYEEVHPVWPLPFITPGTLASLYSLPVNLPVRSERSTIAVAEFLEQYYSQTDLDEFFRLTGVPKQSPPLVMGPNDQLQGRVNGTEAQLDIQYIMGLASNVTTWFWSVPGRNAQTKQEPFLEWLFELSNTPDSSIPLVHSVSYGDDESDMELWYAKRLNTEFMKMGLRGLTVLVSSGDDGAAGSRSRTDPSACRSNNPELPASLPYVTAVGGTQLARNTALVCGARLSGSVSVQCHYDREKACMASTGGGITSGGGFSRYFERPWYQTKLVSHYLKYPDQPLPTATDYFNPNGRAYPDMSAYANNFLVLMDGEFQLVHGTSASTPVVAAIVAHMNDIRLQRGEPPVGFLNPLLYYWAEFYPHAFNDILVGDNKCGISPYKCCKEGFYASRGWDPVSGIGTPRFDVFAELLTSHHLTSAVDRFSSKQVLELPACDEVPGNHNMSANNNNSVGGISRERRFFEGMGVFGVACAAALIGFLLTTFWKEYLRAKLISDTNASTTAAGSAHPARPPALSGEHHHHTQRSSPRCEVLLTNLHNPYDDSNNRM